ncbi:hypothetical protein [Streptomyces sp. NPDC006368]|uniref:hypothetical protein n=1 Tax=Streptomyces sp. NPDC006368 TaxID=3156760 RepID=UPI0033B8DC4C
MLRHAIAPVRRYTKVSHDVVRHRRLSSDAKILIILIQGMREDELDKPLGEHAEGLGMKPRAYQRAKEELIACGYYHEWKWQGARGRWVTEQLMSNVTLTREEANDVRDGVPALPSDPPPSPPAFPAPPVSPSAQEPTVGEPEPPQVGDSPPEDENREKNNPHLPPEVAAPEAVAPVTAAPEAEAPPAPETAAPEAEAPPAPEVVAAERVLLSLRHTHRSLLLGVREARGLADAAAEWLRRGLTTADLHHALTSGLPRDGVRSAVGFLRHRLVEKLPVPAAEAPAAPPRSALVACAGPGDEHLFRPVGDETHCGPCRRDAAARASAPSARRSRVSWRALVEQEASVRA